MDAEAAVRAESMATHANMQVPRTDGLPWHEFVRDSPALVVPQVPGLPRPFDPGAGWSASEQALTGSPCPGWLLTRDGRQLTITGPTGPWFQGWPLLTRDWHRSVTARRTALLITGPFEGIEQFTAAAAAGELRLLLVAVHSVS